MVQFRLTDRTSSPKNSSMLSSFWEMINDRLKQAATTFWMHESVDHHYCWSRKTYKLIYICIRQNFSHQSNLDGLQRNRKVAGKILGRRGLCKALVRLHHITLVRKSIYSCSLLSKLRNTHTNQDEGHTRRPRWPERWRDAPRGHQLLMPKHTKSQEIHGTHLKQYSSKENKTPSSLWR